MTAEVGKKSSLFGEEKPYIKWIEDGWF